MSDLSPTQPSSVSHRNVATPANAGMDISYLEKAVEEMLKHLGLPAEKLLVPVPQRAALVENASRAISSLNNHSRERSHYISKMMAAATVGLFDAALNYLWDETITEIRNRVVGFDLRYFFDIAAGDNSDLRKSLKTEDDLPKIDDARLLRAALKIGLITQTGYQRLDHVRYMRNHASAAHPNSNDLTGLELASFLEACINEVMNTPTDKVTASTGQLLANIKESKMEPAELNNAALFFKEMPLDRANTLANGLFGLYTSAERSPWLADNIRLLWPKIWPFISEETRYSYGLRNARAAANADTAFVKASRELLDLVDGTAYLTEELRAIELTDALQILINAHHSFDNFYAEAAPARAVASLIGENGNVPESVRTTYIRTIVECFLGNGYGVSHAAEPEYIKLINRFSTEDAAYSLRIFTDPIFQSLLNTPSGSERWPLFVELIKPKLISPADRQLLSAMAQFQGPVGKLHLDANIRKLATPST